ncbi:MAG TPA: hypothetical protein VEC37_03610, partial [Bacillota bacterium]|nr:hypothetical protein [Bacillota bacterium]
EFGTKPVRYGMILSHTFAELRPVYQGREFVIRFMETAADALRAAGGLEIRVKNPFPVIVEFYRQPTRQREWGDFKRMLTGVAEVDSQWLILTPQNETALKFWKDSGIKEFLESSRWIERVLISNEELVVRLRRFESAAVIRQLADRLSRIQF